MSLSAPEGNGRDIFAQERDAYLAEPADDFTIVYIASRAHSGSTALDMILSSHSAVTSVGEVKRLRRPDPCGRTKIRTAATTKCTCGAPNILACSYWQEIERVMVGDSGLRLVDLDMMTKDADTFVAHNRALFHAVSAVSGKRFIVDSSKATRRLEMFLKTGAFDVRPIHLIRGPLGQVNSVLKKDMNLKHACAAYCQQNLKYLNLVRQTDHCRTRYETLARRTTHEVTRITKWLGLDFEPQQLDWTSGVRHNMGGNRTRFSSSSEIRLDRSWTRELTPSQMAAIWLRTLSTLPIRRFR